MDEWVLDASTEALQRMCDHAAIVDLCNTDESTFRSFFMLALRTRHLTAVIETEWKRFDLLVRIDGRNALVEFKYYVNRRCYGLDGTAQQWKGGAGVQNEREFWGCVSKLHTCHYEPVHSRYLVLVYERLDAAGNRKTYEESYGDLPVSEQFAAVTSFERDDLICKVLEVR